MKFLAFGDVVENKLALERLSQLDFSEYDFLIFDGDILTMELFKKIREERVLKGIPEGVDSEEYLKKECEPEEILKKYTEILTGLNKIFSRIRGKIKIYGVWGNADQALIISRAKIADNIEILHNRVVTIKGYHLVGYSGRPKYIFETYENPTEHAFDEDRAFEELSNTLEPIKNNKIILITHTPPYGILDKIVPEYIKYGIGTYGDKAKGGHIGSLCFKKITQRFKPVLHIFGHIHESKGSKSVGFTTFVNTGSFGEEGEIVQIEVKGRRVEHKFIKI